MGVHEPVFNFSSRKGSLVGIGPKHPKTPDTTLSKAIEEFFAYYPILKQDQGYVDFMEGYAGAYLLQEEPFYALDVFGFSGVSSNLMKFSDGYFWQGEVNIVDDYGFLTFATLDYANYASADIVSTGFAFDLSGSKEWGLYKAENRINVSGSAKLTFYWYCASFSEWIGAVVAGKGLPPNNLP